MCVCVRVYVCKFWIKSLFRENKACRVCVHMQMCRESARHTDTVASSVVASQSVCEKNLNSNVESNKNQTFDQELGKTTYI